MTNSCVLMLSGKRIWSSITTKTIRPGKKMFGQWKQNLAFPKAWSSKQAGHLFVRAP
uniref:Uncharacterized protein n=1 Tax=Nelumbo nucifera TaxID=4432 RepID=A0A822YS28_NELNU|nr:TPA_asm: hypothetical protein HUJ06_006102 [Nelumbo nucifera]